MTSRLRLLLTAPVLAGLIAAPLASAHADWHRGGYGPGRGYYDHGRRGPGVGGIVAGTLLGLGAGAIIGGALAYPPPRPYYYAPPPVVYAPPPVYYAPPGYYPY